MYLGMYIPAGDVLFEQTVFALFESCSVNLYTYVYTLFRVSQHFYIASRSERSYADTDGAE
jgi:hypothetical protein